MPPVLIGALRRQRHTPPGRYHLHISVTVSVHIFPPTITATGRATGVLASFHLRSLSSRGGLSSRGRSPRGGRSRSEPCRGERDRSRASRSRRTSIGLSHSLSTRPSRSRYSPRGGSRSRSWSRPPSRSPRSRSLYPRLSRRRQGGERAVGVPTLRLECVLPTVGRCERRRITMGVRKRTKRKKRSWKTRTSTMSFEPSKILPCLFELRGASTGQDRVRNFSYEYIMECGFLGFIFLYTRCEWRSRIGLGEQRTSSYGPSWRLPHLRMNAYLRNERNDGLGLVSNRVFYVGCAVAAVHLLLRPTAGGSTSQRIISPNLPHIRVKNICQVLSSNKGKRHLTKGKRLRGETDFPNL